MQIEVRFFGAVSNAADNVESRKLKLDGSTLGDLLELIKTTWPATSDYIDGDKGASIVFALNEKALEPVDLTTPLKEGDKFAIMPFVAGG